MRVFKGLRFTPLEFAGALAGFAPLHPIFLGYFAILGLNPSGLLLTLGLANIIIGLLYRLPLPIEPQKMVGLVALNERWQPSQLYNTGWAMGFIWLVLAFTGMVGRLARFTPLPVIRGVQFGLALLFFQQSLKLASGNFWLAVVALVLALLLQKNRLLPGGAVIFLLGLAIMFASQPVLKLTFGFSLPQLASPNPSEMLAGLWKVGLAQMALTLSNAILATSNAVREKFPEAKVGEQKLAWTTAGMNSLAPFLGGIPLCHGMGSFVAQYFFGARTGGVMIIEGTLEVVLGLFFASSVSAFLGAFPLPIIGTLFFVSSLGLGGFLFTLKGRFELGLALGIGTLSLLTNLGVGFLAGLAVYYLIQWAKQRFPSVNL